MSVLLGPIDDEAMVWDAEERRAMAVLADSGLVPRLRLVSSDQGPDGQRSSPRQVGRVVHRIWSASHHRVTCWVSLDYSRIRGGSGRSTSEVTMQDQSQRRGRGARRAGRNGAQSGSPADCRCDPRRRPTRSISSGLGPVDEIPAGIGDGRGEGQRACVALAKSVERLGLFRREVTRARVEMKRQQLAVQRLVRELYVNGGMNGAH